jgi:NAD(P)-dependent dehydrogenase (short-subunit alcohol dehydrogenase family)
MQLKDKVILVTGSTTGIGEAIARRTLREGASVVLHGRDIDRGQAIATELGPRAAFLPGDLSELDTPQRLIEHAVAKFGRLDAVVNNAAWVVRSDVYSTDVELFDKVIHINVHAPLLLIQAALPHLKRTRGCALNIGSINAYTGESNLLAYSVSKGALMTLSRNLADALCYDHVRINHFNVGWVLTPNEYEYKLKDGLPHDWPQNIPAQHAPTGRIMSPDEIAAAAVYWLSDESRPISGSVVDLEQYPFMGRNPTKRGE